MNFAEKQEFDVIIIGGGIIGLNIARELRKRRIERIAIFEKNTACGTEASDAAAGILAPQAESDQPNDFFRLCSQSRNLYPHFAEELRAETGVDVKLEQTGTLSLAFNQNDLVELEVRFERQRAANLPVEKLETGEILKIEPNVSPSVLGGLLFPLDWQVENRRLICALEAALRGAVAFYKQTAVKNLLFAKDKVVGIETEGKKFFADKVVVASGAWSSLLNLSPKVNYKIEVKPIRGQIITFMTNEKLFQHVIYSSQGYVVPRSLKENLVGQVLVGATIEDVGFEKRATGAGLAWLLQKAFEISPRFENLTVSDSWAGLRPKTLDNFPLIGEFPENSGLYFATGHYRNGVLLAPITAKLIADKIARNIDSPFLQTFNPGRFTMNQALARAR